MLESYVIRSIEACPFAAQLLFIDMGRFTYTEMITWLAQLVTKEQENNHRGRVISTFTVGVMMQVVLHIARKVCYYPHSLVSLMHRKPAEPVSLLSLLW